MKKIGLGIAIFASIILGTTSSQAQTTFGSVEYMNELTEPFAKIKASTWEYLKAATKGKGARKVESKRQALIAELKSAKITTSRKKSFEGSSDLKNALTEFLDLNYTVLKGDFDKILDMEDIAEQSYDAMEAYLLAKEKANEKLNEGSNKLQAAQKAYCAKHNIQLTEGEQDKTDKKIEKASQTLKYYNQVYLIFFKSYKQEAYVLTALMKNDVNGLEQHNGTLKTFTTEGLNKLKTFKSYRGDASLKIAAQQIIKFYQTESTKSFPAMVDFYIKKDNYEKAQKVLESKTKKSRTQADIDKFNKAVNEYNTASQKFNQINQTANSERSRFLDQWNKKVETFFSTHSK